MMFDRYTINILSGELSSPKIEPLSLLAIGSGLASGAGQYFGGQQQAAALGSAGRGAEREARRARRLQQQSLNIQRQLLAEGQPLREARSQASIDAINQLLGLVQAPLGESEGFQRSQSAAFRELAGQLGQFGITPESSFFERAAGETTGRLISDEERNRQAILSLLSGLGGDPTGTALGFGQQALGFGGQAANLFGQESQADISRGAVQAGQTAALGNIPGNIANSLLLSSLLGGGGQNDAQGFQNFLSTLNRDDFTPNLVFGGSR